MKGKIGIKGKLHKLHCAYSTTLRENVQRYPYSKRKCNSVLETNGTAAVYIWMMLKMQFVHLVISIQQFHTYRQYCQFCDLCKSEVNFSPGIFFIHSNSVFPYFSFSLSLCSCSLTQTLPRVQAVVYIFGLYCLLPSQNPQSDSPKRSCSFAHGVAALQFSSDNVFINVIMMILQNQILCIFFSEGCAF